jgi:hypothetical protein
MIGFRGVLSFFEGCALARFIAPNAWRTRSRNSAWSTNTRSTPFLKTQAIFSPVQETALLTPAETVPHFCSWKTDRHAVDPSKVVATLLLIRVRLLEIAKAFVDQQVRRCCTFARLLENRPPCC